MENVLVLSYKESYLVAQSRCCCHLISFSYKTVCHNGKGSIKERNKVLYSIKLNRAAKERDKEQRSVCWTG